MEKTDDRVDALARGAGFEAAFATDNAPRDHAANLYGSGVPWCFRATMSGKFCGRSKNGTPPIKI